MPLNKHDFSIKTNNTLPSLIVNIFDRGDLFQKRSFDLQFVTAITFSMMDQQCGEVIISSKSARTICVSGGTIAYDWDLEDTSSAGDFVGEFELFFINGGNMTIPQINGINIQIINSINSF